MDYSHNHEFITGMIQYYSYNQFDQRSIEGILKLENNKENNNKRG